MVVVVDGGDNGDEDGRLKNSGDGGDLCNIVYEKKKVFARENFREDGGCRKKCQRRWWLT